MAKTQKGRIKAMIEAGPLNAGDVLTIKGNENRKAKLTKSGHVQMTLNAWLLGVKQASALNMYEYVLAPNGKTLSEIRADAGMDKIEEISPEHRHRVRRLMDEIGVDAMMDIMVENG